MYTLKGGIADIITDIRVECPNTKVSYDILGCEYSVEELREWIPVLSCHDKLCIKSK